MSSQRDVFLAELLKEAKKDDKIILLSADMGAPTLDIWREELPQQVIQTGIAEQSTINFAAGLSSRGFKVYVYTMGCWAARCFEQMRYSCGMANIPITFLANGVGLGYVPSGPGHESTEDIAYMRSLVGVEVYSPANCNVVKALVPLTLQKPKFRYIRLERSYDKALDEFYQDPNDEGFVELGMGYLRYKDSNICIISSGHMLGRALELQTMFKENIDVMDLWRIKPIDPALFKKFFYVHEQHKKEFIITLEEQTLSGGFGSAVCEMLCDLGLDCKVLRLGLPERYIFDNGTREEVLDMNGMSIEDLHRKISKFLLHPELSK